jgi:ADP-heptose:LPS heptosyltransferase
MAPAASRRVLFVLRGKLGDTVLAFATVRAWADRFPGDEVTLLVRANYAPLFAREAGLRVIGFGSRIAMFARLAWMGIAEPPFDALMVLLGYGRPIERLGRLVRARRKVYLDGRFAGVFPEWPQVPADHLQPEPPWRVAALVAPELPMPRRARIESLAALRTSPKAIGIAPVSDEARRTVGPGVVHELIGALHAQHAGAPIHVIVNRSDRLALPLLATPLPAGAQFRDFPTLERLAGELAGLAHLYSTDTGLYHLAVAMGVPATVFFGPTQPWKIGMPEQPQVSRVRLAALKGEHCEEKGCGAPLCLEQAVRLFIGRPAAVPIEAAPAKCLLRRHPPNGLAAISIDENPRR